MTDFEQYDVNKIKNKLDTDIVQQKTDELNTLHTHLDQLIKQKQAYDVNVALRAQKQADLTTYQQQLVTLQEQQPLHVDVIVKHDLLQPMLKNETIETLDKTIQHLLLMKQKLSHLSTTPMVASATTTYTLQDLQSATALETQYQHNQRILQPLNLSTQQNIDDYIAYLINILDSQDYLRAQEDLKSLNVVDVYQPNPELDIIQNDIQLLSTQLEQLKLAQQSIACPHCHQLVLYQNKQLVKINNTTNNVEDQLKQCQNDLASKRQQLTQLSLLDQQHRDAYHVYQIKHSDLSQKLASLTVADEDTPCLKETEKNQLRGVLNQLKSITLVDKPITPSADIKCAIEQQEAYKQYQQLLSSIDPDLLDCDIVLLDKMIKQLQIFNTFCKNKQDKTAWLTQHCQLLTTYIDNMIVVDDPSSIIVTTQSQIDDIKVTLSSAAEAETIYQTLTVLNNDKTEVDGLKMKVKQLEQLKDYATQVERDMLTNVVNTINHSLIDVCETMFMHDMAIDLGLFKTLKATQVVKPTVNFNITYKGGKYDHVME